MQTIDFAGKKISRLIVGGNPFSGNSHLSHEMNIDMLNYFSAANIKKTLFRCAEFGVNAAQMRGDKHIMRVLWEFRNEGGEIDWIAQTASETYRGGLNEIVNYGPLAIYHHGTLTDHLFKERKFDRINDNLKEIRDTGVWVGLATHMPEVVDYAGEHGWDVDFYMTCVYNLSKVDRVSSALTGRANEDEPFFDEDRALMYEAVRKTDKPCLVFKILGATRRCETPDTVREAFTEAFANIKATDAVIVGMFPRDRDQVAENVGIVNDILCGR